MSRYENVKRTLFPRTCPTTAGERGNKGKAASQQNPTTIAPLFPRIRSRIASMAEMSELLDPINISATDDKLGLVLIFQSDLIFAPKPFHHLTNVFYIHNR